ncbi:MAG TPA: discoidin domain-containing protein [Thermomicrobiales bacterium]|nr:discoidin domain-containing protein [Thermomicrobiales bacterium]
MQTRLRRAEGERWLLRPIYVIVILSLLIGTLGPSSLFRPSDAAAAPALYPDLKTTRPSGLYFDRVTMSDGLSHYVLRFSNTVWNDGEGRLELQGDPRPDGSSKVYQNVYDSPSGGTRVSQRHVSSDIVYHPSHYHYHFQGFASYLMLKRDAAGIYQATTKKGTKTGFCIMDSSRISSRGSSYAKYTSCNGSLQGISVGWGDLYQGSLPEQWIDLGTTRLADGYYAIQSTADPLNKLSEGGRDGNNVGTTYFRVSSGTITIGSGPAPAPTPVVTNPSGTMNPSFSGSALAPTRSWGTSNGSGSPYVRDNQWSTSWYTVSNHSSGSFTIDYGQVRQLTGVRWGFNAAGLADQFTVDTSSDGQTWSRVGTFGNGQKFTWYGIALGRQGRYVRVTFTNPNGDPKIGYMAEIQLWGTAATTTPTPTPTPTSGVTNPPGTLNPTFDGSRATITGSSDSPTTGTARRAHDSDTNTSWYVGGSPSSATLTVDLGANYDVSGVKWKFYRVVYGDQFTVTAQSATGTRRSLGQFGNAPTAQTFYGVATTEAVSARYIIINFTNVNADVYLGSISELEVWTRSSSSSSLSAAGVIATSTPSPTVSPTFTPSPTSEPTATATPNFTATPTVEPTATAVPTEEPTEPLVTGVGYIVNDGNGANCRPGPSQDEPPITVLADGTEVTTLGDPVDGWQPVLCVDQEGTEQRGYVFAEYISPSPPAATEVATAPGEDAPATEEGAPTEELAVTEAATVGPYEVAGIDDSESSGTASRVVDGDPATTWQVSPAASPDESWLLLDLGAVVPVERVSIELGYGGSLPPFELWLSEDGSNWWNVAQRNGWEFAPGVEYEVSVDAWTRYVMVVVPDVAGLDTVGGIGEVRVWPAVEAGSLAGVGSLVTPEPDPDPTSAPVEDTPTEASEAGVETIVAATEEMEPDIPETIEATISDESDLGGESDATTEETPTPEN